MGSANSEAICTLIQIKHVHHGASYQQAIYHSKYACHHVVDMDI